MIERECRTCCTSSFVAHSSVGTVPGFRVPGSRLGSGFRVRSTFLVHGFQVPRAGFLISPSLQSRLRRTWNSEPRNAEPLNPREPGTNEERGTQPGTRNPEPGTNTSEAIGGHAVRPARAQRDDNRTGARVIDWKGSGSASGPRISPHVRGAGISTSGSCSQVAVASSGPVPQPLLIRCGADAPPQEYTCRRACTQGAIEPAAPLAGGEESHQPAALRERRDRPRVCDVLLHA